MHNRRFDVSYLMNLKTLRVDADDSRDVYRRVESSDSRDVFKVPRRHIKYTLACKYIQHQVQEQYSLLKEDVI